MKKHEIREMSDTELVKRIAEEQANIIDMRFQHEFKNLTNTAKLPLTRRDIARMKTVLREREIVKSLAEKVSKQGEG